MKYHPSLTSPDLLKHPVHEIALMAAFIEHFAAGAAKAFEKAAYELRNESMMDPRQSHSGMTGADHA